MLGLAQAVIIYLSVIKSPLSVGKSACLNTAECIVKLKNCCIKGIKSRKQYTLTLKEDTYNLILEKAREEDLSFAKFMERAALEYIESHE